MKSLIDSVDIIKHSGATKPNRAKKLVYKVSFRLDARLGAILEDRAKATGTTPHDVARTLIEEKLNRNDEALLDGLNFLAAQMNGLREQVGQRLEETEQGIRELVLEEMKEVREVNARNFKALAETLSKKGKG